MTSLLFLIAAISFYGAMVISACLAIKHYKRDFHYQLMLIFAMLAFTSMVLSLITI